MRLFGARGRRLDFILDAAARKFGRDLARYDAYTDPPLDFRPVINSNGDWGIRLHYKNDPKVGPVHLPQFVTPDHYTTAAAERLALIACAAARTAHAQFREQQTYRPIRRTLTE